MYAHPTPKDPGVTIPRVGTAPEPAPAPVAAPGPPVVLEPIRPFQPDRPGTFICQLVSSPILMTLPTLYNIGPGYRTEYHPPAESPRGRVSFITFLNRKRSCVR